MQVKHSFSDFVRTKIVLSGLLFLLVSSCNESERIKLNIDFNNLNSIEYLLGVDIFGKIDFKDTGKTFNGSLRAYLQRDNDIDDSNTILFKISQPHINSDFISDQESRNLEYQFAETGLLLFPHEGAVYIADTNETPVVSVGGWDLFRNFTKVLPVLPQSSVKPGNHWDREQKFPVETTHGNATGHLYQYYTFDSLKVIDSVRTYAFLSWIFSYRIELIDFDMTEIMKNVPLEGRGKGYAVIDIKNSIINRAHADFEIPSVAGTEPDVYLSESVHLELVE